LARLSWWILAQALSAAAQSDDLFQRIHYDISVTLDDQRHVLTGEVHIRYTHLAPFPIDSIWFHLWGNAFNGQPSAFGRQLLAEGRLDHHFAAVSARGGYSDLRFAADGVPVDWYLLPADPDLAVLKLHRPLAPGETVVLSTPFTLGIPEAFSRLGHIGNSYHLTQWYPKPAVLDRKGWHPLPYLDQGEFYAPFGTYDVSVNLPDNYLVAATGMLRTDSEQAWLLERVARTETFLATGFPSPDTVPASSATRKTLRYTAGPTHDFALFADKRFHVLREEAVLPSGRKVPAWAFFTQAEAERWAQAASYVRRALEHYSRLVGEYPWPQASVVQISTAGGGMEYPMVAAIGKTNSLRALDQVITHEIGHNWFYGILGTHERAHAWMDEGINTYYEYRYMRTHYGHRSGQRLPPFLEKGTDTDLVSLAWLQQARRRTDQPPETSADRFSPQNYLVGAYIKPGLAFGHLEAYLGTQRFDIVMQSFFRKWQFRHPYPADMRKHFEEATGKDLSWFFEGYLGSTRSVDYALLTVGSPLPPGGGPRTYRVRIENKGELPVPFPLTAYRGAEALATTWVEGFSGVQTIHFAVDSATHFTIDPSQATLDLRRRNNTCRSAAVLGRVEPLRVRLAGLLEDNRVTPVNLLPVSVANAYDGIMVGLLWHNGLLPFRQTACQLLPLYGTASGAPAGTGRFTHHVFPGGKNRSRLSVGWAARQFTYRTLDSLPTESGFAKPVLSYRRFQPFLRWEWSATPSDKRYQALQWRSRFLWREKAVFGSTVPFYTGKQWEHRRIHDLSWEIGDRGGWAPFSVLVDLEHQRYRDAFGRPRAYLRTTVEGKVKVAFGADRWVRCRLFAGRYFPLAGSGLSAGILEEAFSLTGQGFNDYRYDELYFGRSEADGLLSMQVAEREGGMKIPLGGAFSQGRSNTFLVALNIVADLPEAVPVHLPVRPYLDLGYYSDRRPVTAGTPARDRLWWQGGLALELGDGILGVYFPLVQAAVLRGTARQPGLYDQSGRERYLERVAFSVRLSGLDPWALAGRFRKQGT
jgi:hypothetical protein